MKLPRVRGRENPQGAQLVFTKACNQLTLNSALNDEDLTFPGGLLLDFDRHPLSTYAISSQIG